MKEINLIDNGSKNKRFFSAGYFYLGLGVVIILMATIGFGYLMSRNNSNLDIRITNAQIRIEADNIKIKNYKKETEDVANVSRELKTLADLDKKRISWTDIIYEFSKTVPSNVKVDSFSADSDPLKFTISAQTLTRQDIEGFKKRIEDSPIFKDVFYNSSNESGEGSAKRVSFSFTFNIETQEEQANAK